MTMLPEKKKQVSFFDPQAEMEVKRRKMLAESLAKKGNEEFKNETAGGMTVARSPWEFINKGAQKYLGEYQMGQADDKAAELEKKRQQAIADALSKWGSNPQEAAMILGQDPRTSEVAMKLMQGEVDYGRQKERWAQEDALRREQIEALNQRASMGGNIPAPMQIANQMFELEQRMNNPNLPMNERFLAEREYNLLGQAAKTYGFDRGMQVNMGGYDSVYGQPPMNQPSQQTTTNPNIDFGQPTGQPLDPMQASQQAIAQRQGEIGANPYQNTVSSIQGYDQAMAGREAAIEAEKAKAKKVNEAMPANIVQMQDDLISKINTSQGLESKMGKFVNQIDSGQLDLGLMANLENMARNNVGMSTEQSRNLASFKANLENLRNESLRLNTGVQTDGDAQRAWNELIANINDPMVVRQRLQEIAKINNMGAQLQQQRLNQIRSEYGRGGLEVPNLYNQQPKNQPQFADNPQTGEVMVNYGNGWEPYNGR